MGLWGHQQKKFRFLVEKADHCLLPRKRIPYRTGHKVRLPLKRGKAHAFSKQPNIMKYSSHMGLRHLIGDDLALSAHVCGHSLQSNKSNG